MTFAAGWSQGSHTSYPVAQSSQKSPKSQDVGARTFSRPSVVSTQFWEPLNPNGGEINPASW